MGQCSLPLSQTMDCLFWRVDWGFASLLPSRTSPGAEGLGGEQWGNAYVLLKPGSGTGLEDAGCKLSFWLCWLHIPSLLPGWGAGAGIAKLMWPAVGLGEAVSSLLSHHPTGQWGSDLKADRVRSGLGEIPPTPVPMSSS